MRARLAPRSSALHRVQGRRSTKMGGGDESRGWRGEDFVDPLAGTQPLVETDPWELDPAPPNVPQDSHADLSHLDAAGVDSDPLSDLLDLTLHDPEAEALGDEGWLPDGPGIDSTWDEPEPRTDAASDLSEVLYPADDSVTNLSLDLRIGEVLARVAGMDDEQRAKCRRLLKACRLGRLRRMLPWMLDRQWRGGQLQLFLEFQRHWESSVNVRWWEIFLWNEWERRWMPNYWRDTLTLEHVRELTLKRSRYSAEEVIDDAWLRDWDAYAPWESGIPSFASFAVFRAGIPSGRDWHRDLARQDGRNSLEIAQCLDPTFAPFMLPSIAQQYRLPTGRFGEAEPWAEATELAQERALRSGGDLGGAWREILSGSADV